MTHPPLREDEVLALDLLTFREHTLAAGDTLDPEVHAGLIRAALSESENCTVRRQGALVAYAMIRRLSGDDWFVLSFNTHPGHRSAPVLRELLLALARKVKQLGAAQLISHVYKTNRLSMAFHAKLGFVVTKENDKAVEFRATVANLAKSAWLRRRH